jgi:hypothetical protein
MERYKASGHDEPSDVECPVAMVCLLTKFLFDGLKAFIQPCDFGAFMLELPNQQTGCGIRSTDIF